MAACSPQTPSSSSWRLPLHGGMQSTDAFGDDDGDDDDEDDDDDGDYDGDDDDTSDREKPKTKTKPCSASYVFM